MDREGEREREIDFKDLAHSIVEAWQIQNMMGWADRLENQGELQLESKGNLLEEFLLAQRRSAFVLFRPSNDWMRPTHIMAGNLLYSKVH